MRDALGALGHPSGLQQVTYPMSDDRHFSHLVTNVGCYPTTTLLCKVYMTVCPQGQWGIPAGGLQAHITPCIYMYNHKTHHVEERSRAWCRISRTGWGPMYLYIFTGGMHNYIGLKVAMSYVDT